LQALFEARRLLPPPARLLTLRIVANGFACRVGPNGLEPELVLFHGQNVFSNLLPEFQRLGVHLRLERLTGGATLAGPDPAQVELACNAGTRSDHGLKGGARLLQNQSGNLMGTMGIAAVRRNVNGLVTNRHVIDDAENGELRWPTADKVVARFDAVKGATVDSVDCQAVYGPDAPAAQVTVDAAFVPVTAANILLNPLIHGLEPPAGVRDVRRPAITLVGEVVEAFGAASGRRRGVVSAVLVEWHAPGETHLTDFLIGCNDDHAFAMSSDGDSGGVWMLVRTRELLALHHSTLPLTIGGRFHWTALASNLSAALRELDAAPMT
jgi:hypothetical protein